MLPIDRRAPPRRAPLVVTALALANGVAYAGLLALGEADAAACLGRWGLVPRELLRGAAAADAWLPRVWLTPLSALFLHASLPHLAGNLLVLGIFGPALEARCGHARTALLYLTCGVAAALAHVASEPAGYVPAVGASGAIAGLLGAYAAQPGERAGARRAASLVFALWIGLQLVAGLSDRGGPAGVAWWSHVAGFAAGVLWMRLAWVHNPAPSRLRS